MLYYPPPESLIDLPPLAQPRKPGRPRKEDLPDQLKSSKKDKVSLDHGCIPAFEGSSMHVLHSFKLCPGVGTPNFSIPYVLVCLSVPALVSIVATAISLWFD